MVLRRVSVAILAACAAGALWLGSVRAGTARRAPGSAAAVPVVQQLGAIVAGATDEQRELFERGRRQMMRRFELREGLGPAFNVTFCGGCHQKPTIGGGAALYRNFFLAGKRQSDGTFSFAQSAGNTSGTQRLYSYEPGMPARPSIPGDATVFAQRKSVPMFGAGLLAGVSGEEIRSREDPNDADGDGISGRANFDVGGFVGRFGRKAQTATLEGFVRGPLFNHLGITTDPLTDAQCDRLPASRATRDMMKALARFGEVEHHVHDTHTAVPFAPTRDADGVPDPELSGEEVMELVAFSMLLAPPAFDEPTPPTRRGERIFHEIGCAACHVPALRGPDGPVSAYSDLLLHDMGPELADGIELGVASGAEFRTQPLWGVVAAGPYLHDGRADTMKDAILMHGGEARASAERFAALPSADQGDVLAFLSSLGGARDATSGLLPPGAPVPEPGAYGGPYRALNAVELERFVRGRELFDRDFGHQAGLGGLSGADGAPRFNGDSCRACHSDPVIGGAGPRDVNVIRHGTLSAGGQFVPPATTVNTVLHKEVRVGHSAPQAEAGVNVYEQRQSPHTLGSGLVDAIPVEAILALEDPTDADGDRISGRAHRLPDGRIGRFGWKAQVPTLAEFLADATAVEIGLTLPDDMGLTLHLSVDEDGVPDPELSRTQVEDLLFYLTLLAPPPRQAGAEEAAAVAGEAVFEQIGCTKCHVPSLPSTLPDYPQVPLYSDLLLHEILPAERAGVADGAAQPRELRTPPLWGLSTSAPYLHNGLADTVDEAIRLHDGEGAAVRDAYLRLSDEERRALHAFLNTL